LRRIVGSGTKAVHDLVGLAQKSKEKSDNLT
jgi:hypothetical protein